MGRLFFDFVLKEWLEVGINLANAHIPCLIVLNQLEVDAAEGQNTDNVQHCRYCAEKVGDLPDKAGRKAIAYCVKNSQQAGNRVQVAENFQDFIFQSNVVLQEVAQKYVIIYQRLLLAHRQ